MLADPAVDPLAPPNDSYTIIGDIVTVRSYSACIIVGPSLLCLQAFPVGPAFPPEADALLPLALDFSQPTSQMDPCRRAFVNLCGLTSQSNQGQRSFCIDIDCYISAVSTQSTKVKIKGSPKPSPAQHLQAIAKFLCHVPNTPRFAKTPFPQDQKQVSVRGFLKDIKTKVIKGDVIIEYFEVDIIDIAFLAGGHAAGDSSLPNTLDGGWSLLISTSHITDSSLGATPRRNGFLQFRPGSPLKPGSQSSSNSPPVKRTFPSVPSNSLFPSGSGVRDNDGPAKRPRVQESESAVTARGIVIVDTASGKGKKKGTFDDEELSS